MDLLEVINSVLPVIITGLFGIIMWKLQTAENSRKENRQKQDERMEAIEKNVATLTEQVKTLTERADIKKSQLEELKTIVERLEKASEVNDDAVRTTMRYMLGRYHSEYMHQGFITSDQLKNYLEMNSVYERKHGNGTGTEWLNEIKTLPVRDDIPIINPFIELIKYLDILKKSDCKYLKEVNNNG